MLAKAVSSQDQERSLFLCPLLLFTDALLFLLFLSSSYLCPSSPSSTDHSQIGLEPTKRTSFFLCVLILQNDKFNYNTLSVHTITSILMTLNPFSQSPYSFQIVPFYFHVFNFLDIPQKSSFSGRPFMAQVTMP